MSQRPFDPAKTLYLEDREISEFLVRASAAQDRATKDPHELEWTDAVADLLKRDWRRYQDDLGVECMHQLAKRPYLEPGSQLATHGTMPTTPWRTNGKPQKVEKLTVDERMLLTLLKQPEFEGWTSRQWAMHLKCSPSTVVGTKTWKGLTGQRELTKAEHAPDRRRNGRRMGG
jgi:hypothetical protein